MLCAANNERCPGPDSLDACLECRSNAEANRDHQCAFDGCLWCEWKRQGRPMTFRVWQTWTRFFMGMAATS